MSRALSALRRTVGAGPRGLLSQFTRYFAEHRVLTAIPSAYCNPNKDIPGGFHVDIDVGRFDRTIPGYARLWEKLASKLSTLRLCLDHAHCSGGRGVTGTRAPSGC